MTPPLLPPFKSVTFEGRAAGPRLIVLGGVHGNETCGPAAIARVIAAIEGGEIVVAAGRLTFVPIANPLAVARGRREGERNLNRALFPTEAPRQFEDHVANWLCPLLAAHEVLLDLHSFSADGAPFALLGPCDNAGPLEPFAHAEREAALVRHLGVARAVEGWIPVYAEGVRRRRERLAARGADVQSIDLRHGVGTTEYMRLQGGFGVTLECGRHDDPDAPRVAETAVRHALVHLGLVDGPPPPRAGRIEGLRLTEVVDRLHPQDRLLRDWHSFDPVTAGEPIAVRADGCVLCAPHGGRIVFPNAGAAVDDEWYFLAEDSGRFG